MTDDFFPDKAGKRSLAAWIAAALIAGFALWVSFGNEIDYFVRKEHSIRHASTAAQQLAPR